VNFIGELTSVESLRSLIHLKEMYAARSNSRLIYFHAVFIFFSYLYVRYANADCDMHNNF